MKGESRADVLYCRQFADCRMETVEKLRPLVSGKQNTNFKTKLKLSK